MSDDTQQETEPQVPRWVIFAAVGLASYVGYKLFMESSKIDYKNRKYIAMTDKDLAFYPKGEKYYSVNPDECVEIRKSDKGPASWRPTTVFQVFEKCVNNKPLSPFFKKEYLNNNNEYKWKTFSRQEFYNKTKQAARSFIHLGLKQFQSVVCIGFNSPEWFISDLGAIYAGGLIAGIYTTNNPGQIKYISEHCRACVAVVEGEKQLNKFLSIRNELPELKAIVVWNIEKNSKLISDANNDVSSKDSARIYHWDEFMSFGDENNQDTSVINELNNGMNNRINSIKPGNACTLIYTSGTTGPPKAVMLSHDNITWQSRNSVAHMPIDKTLEFSCVSYLPLSHVAAQLADIHMPMAIMAHHIECPSVTVHFARPDAMKGTLGLTLKAARPTMFFGVPRVWEKFAEKIKAKAQENPATGLKKKLVDWAKSVGIEYWKNSQITGNKTVPSGYTIANKLVFSKVKEALGFDRLKLAYTGAAPVQAQTLNFFAQLGIGIYEVYGMSESTGIHTLCMPFHHIQGTVGYCCPGSENVLDNDPTRDKKGEGEICMRGRHVMMGYMYDVEKTKKTIDSEGLLHSGDVGSVNEYGLLKITGRIKELIITAGGENIAPIPIEDYIKKECSGISNVILIGDKKKFLSILITLKVEQNLDTLMFNNVLTGDAKSVDKSCKTVNDARKSETWKKYIEDAINKYNNDSDACVSRAQRVQKYTILDGDFSVPGGTLTSTMKLKRPIIYKNYADQIDSMY